MYYKSILFDPIKNMKRLELTYPDCVWKRSKRVDFTDFMM